MVFALDFEVNVGHLAAAFDHLFAQPVALLAL